MKETVSQRAGLISVDISPHNLTTNQISIAVFRDHITSCPPRTLNDWHIVGAHDANIDTIGTAAGGSSITHHAEIAITCAMLIRNRGHE